MASATTTSNLTNAQANVLAAIGELITAKRRWVSLTALQCFDGRTVRSLWKRGLIEINAEYGARVLSEGQV